MSFFSRLYSGIYDKIYSYKFSRYRNRLNTTFEMLKQQIERQPKDCVDKSQIKHVLIIKNETLGAMVLVTPLIRNLVLNGFKVDVLTSQASKVVVANNPFVHELFTHPNGASEAKKFVQETMKDKHYDMVLDLRCPEIDEDLEQQVNIDRAVLPQYISCDYLIGWNRSNFSFYDESLSIGEEKGHFTQVVDAFLRYMQIENADLSYDLYIDAEIRENGLHYIRDLWRKGGPVVVINPFTSNETHNFSDAQVKSLVNRILEGYPFAQIIFIGMPDKLNSMELEPHWEGCVYKYISPSIMDVVPLIEFADVVISPESAVVHIAAAYKKPTVALYLTTLNAAGDGKENAQREFVAQQKLAHEEFFDGPHIKSGLRPKDALLREYLLGPNNERAIHKFSSTGLIADLSAQNIYDEFDRLVSQFVRDPQYVAPIKGIAYQGEQAAAQLEDGTVKELPLTVDAAAPEQEGDAPQAAQEQQEPLSQADDASTQPTTTPVDEKQEDGKDDKGVGVEGRADGAPTAQPEAIADGAKAEQPSEEGATTPQEQDAKDQPDQQEAEDAQKADADVKKE